MVGFCERKLGALLQLHTSDFIGRNFQKAKISKIFKRKIFFEEGEFKKVFLLEDAYRVT